MNNGSTKDYTFGQKKHWRRWQWNSIVKQLNRLRIPTHSANVIYLAGRENHDLQEAIARGFMQQRMIAIDCDRNVVAALRADGMTAIRSRLKQIVGGWGNDEIHVVVADVCSGWTKENANTMEQIIRNPVFRKCAVAFNFQRGRETCSRKEEFNASSRRNHKHRAKMAKDDLEYGCRAIATEQTCSFHKLLPSFYCRELNMSAVCEVLIKAATAAVVTAGFKYSTYRSDNGLVFDSCVYVNPSIELIIRHAIGIAFGCGYSLSNLEHSTLYEESWNQLKPLLTCDDRIVAAAKAVRNRRIQRLLASN